MFDRQVKQSRFIQSRWYFLGYLRDLDISFNTTYLFRIYGQRFALRRGCDRQLSCYSLPQTADYSALLIGDAAHALSPALGQGCNSALEDVSILNGVLDEYADDLEQTLAQFTVRRLPDALAVVELSDYSLPSQKSLFVEFILRMRMAQFLHQLFPNRFFPPLFQAMHEPNIPYREIYDRYRGWCNKVRKSKLMSGL